MTAQALRKAGSAGRRISTRSARSRRSATCRRTCTPGRSARSATARPTRRCRSRCVPTWPLDDDEVLVLVMAAGVNYNGVWAALGQPISTLDVHKQPLPHRRLRRLRHRLGGRLQGEALEGRRRGRRPLQPGRRRRRGVQRRRSDVLAVAAHLGLRDAGRLLRPVLPRAGPPAHGAAEAPHLGGERLLHADARHRLPHAVRPPAAHACGPATTCWCGAPRAASARWRCSSSPPPAPTPSASSRTTTSATSSCSSAPRASSTARTSTAGASCRRSTRPSTTPGLKEARKFGKAIWDITGKGNNVDFVFEHPGRGDLPGLDARGEARRHGGVLRRHHRLQPHHGRALSCGCTRSASRARTSPTCCRPRQANKLVVERRIDPCMSRGVPLGADPQGAHARCGRTSTSPATWRCWSTRRAPACAPSRT